MGADSKIGWTEHTFNTHWGCQRVSPGCEHCYAETFSKRVGLKVWGPQADRRKFGDKHWAEPLNWNRAAEKAGERHRVFCASMADVFEDRRDLDAERARLWPLIEQTTHLDWLLLTKRPENVHRMAPWHAMAPDNVWIGATAENQEWLSRRVGWAMRQPARVCFLSCEPLLGPLDLSECLDNGTAYGINWVIVGGESGPGARPYDLQWARSIIAQCRARGVPVFHKQLGSNPVDGGNRVKLKHRKGEDWDEWPEDLRVRQFPESSGEAVRDGG